MAQIKTFRDLKVWEKAHQLVLAIYQITSKFPAQEKYGLVLQMRRAAISVASNIVEGFKRRSRKESLNFYNISDGSLEELKYQLLLARDLGYLAQSDFNFVNSLAEETGRTLNGWLKSQRIFP